MSRAQDLLDEAITITKTTNAESSDADLSGRLGDLVGRMESQRDKFFFKSLAGVPLANKAKKAAQSVQLSRDDASVGALQTVIEEIEDKSDAPGTVLT